MNELTPLELEALESALGAPAPEETDASRRRVNQWFARTAPLIRWDVIASPLGSLYVAAGRQGLRRLDFGISEADFLSRLDPRARTQRDPAALAPVVAQLRAYFAGERALFELPLDLGTATPFQRSVLQTARRIPSGTVWTYGQVARAIGNPRASRAVGQALGRNPVPIVIPCHRVVTSDGGLGGYSGGGGLDSKRWLLQLEGAL
jgi:methylated-DNA-[protein]-cysteine S-methyltransferase